MWSLHEAIAGALLVTVGLTLFGLHPAVGAAPSGAVDAASAPQALQWIACPHGFLIKILPALATPQTCWGSQRSLRALPENSSR
jgi:hypothetical protein